MTYELPTANWSNNSNGLANLFIYESSQIDIFGGGLLLFIFFIIAVGGFSMQQKRNGTASMGTWFAVSGIITTFLSFILFIVAGIISVWAVVTCITLSIVFMLIKFFADD